MLSRAFCAEVQAAAAASPVLRIWAEKSGWVNERIMARYLSLVADVLDGFPQLLPIIILDCAPAHLCESVLQVAKERGLRLCFVPGGCTAHIQPLDVGCFSPLKAFLRREAREVLSRHGQFTKLDWAVAINKAATKFLSGRQWAPLFRQCGVVGDRAGLKGFLRKCGSRPGMHAAGAEGWGPR